MNKNTSEYPLNVTVEVYSNDIHETISVKIDKIEVAEEYDAGILTECYVNVYHDSEVVLYDCVEFEEAISALFDFEVKFTEKMAQDSYFSRLEAVDYD
jgi:hypothetical protein